MRFIIKQAVSITVMVSLTMLFASTTFGQTSGAIGIKVTFNNAYAGGPDTLMPTDAVGVNAISNWNNIAAIGGGSRSGAGSPNGTWSSLVDGAAEGIAAGCAGHQGHGL